MVPFFILQTFTMSIMNPLIKKLNYKQQSKVHLNNLPKEQEYLIKDFGEQAKIIVDDNTSTIDFILTFCTKLNEVESYTKQIVPQLSEDATMWFAYPKGTSKKYKCEFNRDNGWNILGDFGFEGVRMVAIDEDWSALRFRKAKHIKTMTRSFAMSKEGIEKVNKSKK